MERRLLLDVVVRQRAAVLELFSGEDEALLVRRDALLVLDFLFDVVDGVRRLDVQRDGLARQRLDEDLRARGALSRGGGVMGRIWRKAALSRRASAVGERGDGVRALSLRIAALSRHKNDIAA